MIFPTLPLTLACSQMADPVIKADDSRRSLADSVTVCPTCISILPGDSTKWEVLTLHPLRWAINDSQLPVEGEDTCLREHRFSMLHDFAAAIATPSTRMIRSLPCNAITCFLLLLRQNARQVYSASRHLRHTPLI